MKLSPFSWRAFEQVERFTQGVNLAKRGRPSLLRVHESGECSLSRPEFIGGQNEGSKIFAEKLFSKTRYWSAGVEIVFLPRVYFFSRPGHLIFGSGHICAELDYALNPTHRIDGIELREGVYTVGSWHSEMMNECPRIPGVSYLMYPKWHRNYTHWHSEALVQAPMLCNFIDDVDNFVFPEGPDFQRDSIDLFLQTDPVRQLFLDSPIMHFDVAVLSTSMFARTHLHRSAKEGLELIRERSRSQVDKEDSRNKMIYISRRDSKFRPLRNELELESALSNSGFKIVLGSELTFKEQIKIFHNSEIVVGAHGSGLTNVIYSQPETFVLEIRPQNAGLRSPFIDISYWIIANLLGNPYGAYICPAAVSDSDWVVDVGNALRAIERVLGSRRAGEAAT